MSTRKQRARFVSRQLEELYPRVQISLQHRDPYTLLVAVILSAQCTDKRVNAVTNKLFQLADSPAKMVQLGQRELAQIIRPCGLFNNKSRAIIQTSKILLKEYEGCVPDRFPDLEELPGVGHKTASVVMGGAFGKETFPVDTHIQRLALRWGLSATRNLSQIESDLKELFPASEWLKRHLQFIHYGREYCTARACDGHQCRICRGLENLP